MEMLKSEVKLLLLRNSQLENENLMLKHNEMQLNQSLVRERRLNRALETIKLAQNDYISKLNLLIVDLTSDSADHNNYNLLKHQINTCVKTCRTLQNEYEMCKQSLRHQKTATTSREPQQSSTTNADQTVSEELAINLVPNDLQMDMEVEDEQQMPHLDLVEPQVILDIPHEEDDDDDDPNGAGELYLDAKDKEFVPKRILPKSARKTFTFNASTNGVEISPKRRKHKNKDIKTSQKFGDKFRCNWKGCEFISSYKQNVERHYRVHTGERPFKCQFKGCTFSASQAGNLKVHQQRHGHQSPNGHKFRLKASHNATKTSPKKETTNKTESMVESSGDPIVIEELTALTAATPPSVRSH